MSFESFRTDLTSRLVNLIPTDCLQSVLNVMDEMSLSWSFETACTSLITYEGLPDAVRVYLASKTVENLALGTLKNYYSTLRDFFEVVRVPVENVSSANVRLWLNWFKQERKISNSYLDHKRIILNSFFAWLVDEDMIRKNPMRHIKPIKSEESVRLPMSQLELEKVRKSCKTLREKALVDFLYSTAARISEVVNMKIDDINFTDRTVLIRCGKGGKTRITFINAESEVSLRAYLASRTDDDPAVFVSVKKPIHGVQKKALEIEVANIVSRCNISVHVTPHVFRHTAASLALQRGMPIDQVQKWLGHARIQTTLRYAKTLNFDVKLSHQKYVA